MKLQEKFETTGGTVWKKYVPEASDNATSPNYYKKGEPGSKSRFAYAGASDHVETRYVTDGQSTPHRPTEIPVPDSESSGDFRFEQVEQREASQIGMVVNQSDPLVEEHDINGQTYHADDLKGAFQRAQRQAQQPVRYLQ